MRTVRRLHALAGLAPDSSHFAGRATVPSAPCAQPFAILAALALCGIAASPACWGQSAARGQEPWNGAITWNHVYGDKGVRQQGDYKDEWDYSRHAQLTITLTDGHPHAVMQDSLQNWQKSTTPFVKDTNSIQIITSSETGQGEGDASVWIEFDDEMKTYWLKADGPDYAVLRKSRLWSNVIEMGGGGPQPEEQTTRTASGVAIDVPDHPVGGNPNVLTGQSQVRVPVGGSGDNLTTISWGLVKGPLDVQLVVTPERYDSWLPEPGADEATAGKDPLKILLRAQDSRGGPPALPVIRFELKLVDTSSEPGIALNAPLSTSRNPSPDLRFLEQEGADVSADGQSVVSGSEDGSNGAVQIGAYDGGGWTTLVAEAVLQGGLRIRGHLLSPAGATETLLPKRTAGAKIASRWLTAHGNPGERDDDEHRDGNAHLGDGLSAYEEYRGVVRKNEFFRLDPRVRELGVLVNEQELPLFADGLSLFHSASGVAVIPFFENEIASNRRLNPNASHAHVYDQYALRLEDGSLSGGVAGENRPIAVLSKLPRNSERVVIDLQGIEQAYQAQSAAMPASMPMPYTLAESIASTVAHELAHGVNVNHHGPPSSVPQGRVAFPHSQPPYHIYDTDGVEITLPEQGYSIAGRAGISGNDESGDLLCLMNYTSVYQWAFHVGANGSLNYYAVPPLPVGSRFCPSADGTGLNAAQKYFGNATFGNCASQIQLRD